VARRERCAAHAWRLTHGRTPVHSELICELQREMAGGRVDENDTRAGHCVHAAAGAIGKRRDPPEPSATFPASRRRRRHLGKGVRPGRSTIAMWRTSSPPRSADSIVAANVSAKRTAPHARSQSSLGSAVMKRPNPLHPRHLSTKERLAEVCDLLALGLARLRMRQSSQEFALSGESSLHTPPRQSGRVKPKSRRKG
jgi:hypothetical protein